MSFTSGSAEPVLDPAVTHLDVNSGATSSLVNGAVDAETKVTIPKGIFCDLSFRGSLSATGSSASHIKVYRRDLAIDGTNDASIPTLGNKSQLVGTFTLPILSSGTIMACKLPGVPLNMSGDSHFYIHNLAGASINAGWVVTATSISVNAVA